MKEKNYYAPLSKYYTRMTECSMAIEVKICKGNSLPFSSLHAHQEEFLLQSERAFAHKIPDVGRLRKPYDIILVHQARAVVVVIFYLPRQTEIYEITIRQWIHARQKLKNLTRKSAGTYGVQIYI